MGNSGIGDRPSLCGTEGSAAGSAAFLAWSAWRACGGAHWRFTNRDETSDRAPSGTAILRTCRLTLRSAASLRWIAGHSSRLDRVGSALSRVVTDKRSRDVGGG